MVPNRIWRTRVCAWLQALYDLEKKLPFTNIASPAWCFKALGLFFAIFHATPHTPAKWGCQCADSKFWILAKFALPLTARPRKRHLSHCSTALDERRAAQTGRSGPITKGTARAKYRTISRACLPRGLPRGLSSAALRCGSLPSPERAQAGTASCVRTVEAQVWR